MQFQPPLKLDEIENSLLTPLTKGFPGTEPQLRLKDVGAKHWNLLRQDLPLPVAVLKQSALARNNAWMARFLQRTGVLLCPHGKTTMSPQLFDTQLRAGAWGITAATMGHVHVYRRFGVQRILYANQLVGRQDISYVLDELKADPSFDFYCLVDSLQAVEVLAEAVREQGLQRPLQVLLEMGMAGGRTGVRNLESGLRVARAVAGKAPYLSLRGIESFEGVVANSPDQDPTAALQSLMQLTVAMARAALQENLFAPGRFILSAGGSAYFDVVTQMLADCAVDRALIVLRSGCYLTSDSLVVAQQFQKMLARLPAVQDLGPSPTAALEVWGYVQSMPEPGLAIVNFGKRDVSHDMQFPVPRFWFRPGAQAKPQELNQDYKITALNDQHAYLKVPSPAVLQIGDMLGVGISHPCTTFDKWQVLYLTDDVYNVTGAIRTFF